ncbi:hypothetical protein [Fluoribacter gormanii]|uniref:hypothetical protein n=1 Tax=Fluoribacter gormanii TaxID=464 RepID=UPI00104153C4|nr:hypothetical protein [Fluoribacter gormanii]
MIKLKGLIPSTPEDMLTSQKVGNHYKIVPMTLYDLRDLPQLTEKDLSEKLFQDEDFVIPPKVRGRSWVKAKIGKLYLEWRPDGKGSFLLNIRYIDSKNQLLQPFLNILNPRHSKIELHDLLPFSMSTYYKDYTGKVRRSGHEARVPRSCAYELKLVLTKLLLHEAPSAYEMRNFQENCRKLNAQGNSAQPSVQTEPSINIVYFGLNLHKKPTTLFQVKAHDAHEFLSKTRSPVEIDQWLQGILLPNLSLKERKEGYLLGLENIINELDSTAKKSLAFYILNCPDHFLKKERDFFRSLEYSNDTFSVFQLVKKLMHVPAEAKNNILVIEDKEHHQEYLLSRHT